MSNVPLPNRSCIATYMGDGRGLHYTLGVAAGTALIEQPPGSQLDLYTDDQMRSYAAAVSAAKDVEIAALREQVQHLQSLLVDADNICKEHGGCDLQDCIDNDGDLYQSQAMADALDAARKGEA